MPRDLSRYPTMAPRIKRKDPRKLSSPEARWQHLVREIRRHDILYFVHNTPEMSDVAYDHLFLQLEELEKEHPELRTPESPTRTVGVKPSRKFAKFEHTNPMLSLENAFSRADVSGFLSRVRRFLRLAEDDVPNILAEPKIDGISCALHYADGSLQHGVTRGDGQQGEDVTANVRTIADIPQRLSGSGWPRRLEVRGEVYMEHAAFALLNARQKEQAGKLFASPRNAAAGSLRQLNWRITSNRFLRFLAHGWGGRAIPLKLGDRFSEVLTKLSRWGFRVQDWRLCSDLEAMLSCHALWSTERSRLAYAIDGVVYKLDRLDLWERLGTAGRTPRAALAHKFSPEVGETLLERIDVQVGRSGALTPVAILEPVSLEGVRISRVGLHNEDFIRARDIRVKDVVRIHRAGDVIPQILGVVFEKRPEHSRPFVFPTSCPVCGGCTSRLPHEAVRRCEAGLTCGAQVVRKLVHFCGRSAFNIAGLGKRQIAFLFSTHRVRSPADVFTLAERDKKADSMQRLAAQKDWGLLSARNLFTAIEVARDVSFARFLVALGIRYIGEANARALAEAFGSWSEFSETMQLDRQACEDALKSVSGIGPSAIASLQAFFSEPRCRQAVFDLVREIRMPARTASDSDLPLHNKTIVFTGKLERMSREEAKAQAEHLGARVASSVSAKTDFLIRGENAGNKVRQALRHQVRVLTEEAWLHELRLLRHASRD